MNDGIGNDRVPHRYPAKTDGRSRKEAYTANDDGIARAGSRGTEAADNGRGDGIIGKAACRRGSILGCNGNGSACAAANSGSDNGIRKH